MPSASRLTPAASASALLCILLLALFSSATASVITKPDGLRIEETVTVKCDRPTQNGDFISVHYAGTLENGDKFDDSYKRGRPFTFQLGKHRVIAGWDEGLLGMCVGSRRKLTIPAELGYGSASAGKIPPDSVLIFETRLMHIAGVADPPAPQEDAKPADDKPADGAVPEPIEQQVEEPADKPADDIPIEKPVEEPADHPVDHPTGQPADRPVDHPTGQPANRPVDHPAGQPAEDVPLENAVEEPDDAPVDDAVKQPPSEDKPADKETDKPSFDQGTVDKPNIDDKPQQQGSSSGPVTAAIDEKTGECRLLGPFALLVQSALGVLALLSLVFKRWRERPRRPVKIWFFDVSKQVVGTALLHVANLAMSMLSSPIDANAQAAKIAQASKGPDEKLPNPCSFYLLNLAIDTTIGIPILVVLLRILHALFSRTPLANPPESLKSGHYGTPPRVTWWIKQSFIYFLGLFGMKMFVLFMFQALPWLPWVGDWALRWTEGNESVQIAFVMFLFPLAMNAIQYYIIDTFIKEKQDPGYQSVQQDEDGQDGDSDGQEEGPNMVVREDADGDDKPAAVIRAIANGESSGSDSGSPPNGGLRRGRGEA